MAPSRAATYLGEDLHVTKPPMHAGTDDAEGVDRRGVGRRTVVQAGAAVWAAPVIVTATAAPALAVSGGTITVSKGSTAVVSSGDGFYDVQCASLTVTSTASIPAATLKLTVTFAPKVNEGDPLIYKQATNPAAWVGPSPGTATSGNSLIYTYAGAVSAGVPVAFPNGIYFGTNVLAGTNEGEGVFTLTGSATGLTSGFTTLPTPLNSPRPGAQPAADSGRLRVESSSS